MDAIADFDGTEGDRIVLSRQSFRALTSPVGNALSSNDFRTINASTNNAAALLPARIIYNQGTGDLIYNENGTATGFGEGRVFANLTTRPVLDMTGFLVQA